ncbi:N-6 DNA methylase [Halomarina oriensis]|uniref:N-6 DNA methylase n=1 Tax=Halomarina oriensis TaxID=671145 RepID=A0A6B0GR56_9EURY|nr:N-6 DNA methylase [Halomarina oriensis]MWG35153.1 N-6 DNA methylase [Halomarina oriensis]
MNEHVSVFDRWGRESHHYERYTSNAVDRLADDDDVQAAKAEWEAFFVGSHGDVFDGLAVEDPRTRLFVDALYYDFVVDGIVEFAEREFDFELVNREANYNTDALSVDFQQLHRAVVDVDATEWDVGASLTRADLLTGDVEFLRRLYERIVPRDLRLQLGEYYTPRGVAELSVAELDVADYRSETFFDPGCGSGVFLATCIDAKRDALGGTLGPEALVDVVTNTVFGVDLNPVAVKSAKLGYLLSLLPVLDEADVDRLELPVFLTDSLGLMRDDEIRFGGETLDLRVDHLVGNPPWLTWGNLSESVRDAWRERYVDRLNLLPHDGAEARLGYANDDVSVPFVWVCIHRYLAEDGDASFVLKRDIVKGPAGRLLRSQRVNSRPVAVTHIHDFTDLRPFGDEVGAHASVYTLRADTAPTFPIDADTWRRADGDPEFSSAAAMRETLPHEETPMVPVEADDPSSPWLRADAERRALGECAHDIRHGLKDDAKDVYSLDRSRLDELEHDHVYPYLRSKHVVKYGLFGHDLHLVPMAKANEDNEAELRNGCPKTYEYLDSRREALEDRASTWLQSGTFYNVFGLGEYTWSDYKVVWCRLGFKPHFAVVGTVDDETLGEKPVVPGDHFMFISTDDEYEAHFLCGLLNSAVYQRSLRGIASRGKASLSKTVVSRLELPAYEETEESRRLAELSMAAHDIVPRYIDVSKRAYNERTVEELATVQADIDELVESMLSEGSSGPATGRRPLASIDP